MASAQNVQASPSVLSATLVKGQSTTLTLKLQKSGSDQHVWEPKTNVNWVTLSPNYGSYNTITTETDTVKVTVSTANMTVGTNSGLIYIWDTGSSARLITVPLTRHCDLIGDHGTVTPTSFTAAPSRDISIRVGDPSSATSGVAAPGVTSVASVCEPAVFVEL